MGGSKEKLPLYSEIAHPRKRNKTDDMSAEEIKKYLLKKLGVEGGDTQ